MASTARIDLENETASIETLRSKIFERRGLDSLRPHLERHYKIEVTKQQELDLGVYRVDIKDDSSWVARVFPLDRTVADVKAEATILQLLQDRGFPSERPATGDPVTEHEGQAVLVTKFIEGQKPKGGKKAFYKLGRLLGQLHSMPTAEHRFREGGAWHHISILGGPREEINAARELISAFERSLNTDQKGPVDVLIEALATIDDLHGLPVALTHADFVLANAIVPPEGGFQIVDWPGVGIGSRVASLGWALWVAGQWDQERFDAVLAGYLEQIQPEPDELKNMSSALLLRPLVLRIWEVCTGRRELSQAEESLSEMQKSAETLAARAVTIVGKRASLA